VGATRRFAVAASLLALLSAAGPAAPARAAGKELTVQGTAFFLDGKPFPWNGVSFFNALYNRTFNASPEARRTWLKKLQRYGVNVLRVWGQWDNKKGYVDTCEECTLYYPDGTLRAQHVDRLKALLTEAEAQGMVVELALFAQETWFSHYKISAVAQDKAVEEITRALLPHRNLTIQIWNELSERVLESVAIVRRVDPKRIVSNSPGVSSFVGDPPQNRALDYLSPHTTRQANGRPWLVGPVEIEYLLTTYGKPVVDDEPARNGTKSFGGPGEETFPWDHIIQIAKVWERGGYVIYHHDMFQLPGTPSVPRHGIPDPEHSPYHREVFKFLAQKERYMTRVFPPPPPKRAEPKAAAPGAGPPATGSPGPTTTPTTTTTGSAPVSRPRN
jgi:hypothetical protein